MAPATQKILFTNFVRFSSIPILSKLFVINFSIHMKNWPLATQSHVVSQGLKGVCSLVIRRPKNKFPVNPDILEYLCHVLEKLGYCVP